jgi:DNA-binding transcriptional regulator YiaG
MTNMAPKRTTKVNKRLYALREASGLTQADYGTRYFKVRLRTYQRWESTERHADLPGPVQVIIEALERGGRLPK